MDEKLAAFEHLHMLVEEFDHAIGIRVLFDHLTKYLGMENLGLWPDVISVAKAEEETEELRMWALWTMAAAAHHNPKVQDALLKHGSLDLALGILESQQPFALRQKSILLVSCIARNIFLQILTFLALVKQNTTCFLEFVKLKGFARLENLINGFTEDESNLRDRSAFFLEQLFQERPRLQIEHASLYALVSKHRSSNN